MGEHINITGADGTFSAYMATPSAPNGAAIVVIQEIFGVNHVMRDLTDGFAAQGYFAICPDLFWRIKPGIDITDQTPEEWQQAFDLFGQFKADTGIEDVQAAIDYARQHASKVGTVGYCLGGLLAYLTATRTNTDASVSYYGVGIADKLAESDSIKAPLLMHVAQKDQFVPLEQQATIIAALKDNTHVVLHTYEGLDHAFARAGGAHWDEEGATLANGRTKQHFASALLGQGS